jgi:glycosyltransferase 2 family protein
MSNSDRAPIDKQTWVRALIGLAIGAFFCWLVLRQTSWDSISNVLVRANAGWLCLAMGVYGLSIMVRVVRWRNLLQDVKLLSWRSVATALSIGYAMNNILPARLGELFRADFAGKRYRISRSAVAGSIVVERVLDGSIVVSSLLLGRLFVSDRAVLNSLILVSGTLFFSIFVILWFASRKFDSSRASRLPQSIATRIRQFRTGLTGMQGWGLARAVGISALVWLLEGFAQWSILNAVGVAVGWQQMLTTIGIINLSTLLPSAPGFVGTYQYAYAYSVELFGYQPAQGVAAATLAQIFLLGSLTVVGLCLYFQHTLTTRSTKSSSD